MNGVLVINKPPEFTSFDVVAVVRRLSGQRKIGHTGTLDPNATGVLPLLLGNATKAQDIIENHDKEYTADFRLGYVSDTLDIWGNVKEFSQKPVTKEEIMNVLPDFTGDIEQVPPMFSAVQQNGTRLYDLARRGIEVERRKKSVTVYQLELLFYDEGLREGSLRIKCSRGTYVRTVIDDIGRALSCGGVMTALNRTNACGYSLKDAVTLETAGKLAQDGALQTMVLPTESLFYNCKAVRVTAAQAKRFLNGGCLDISRTPLARGCNYGGIYRIKNPDGDFLGLGKTDKETNQIKIYKLFAVN